jgi:hypothetical protein
VSIDVAVDRQLDRYGTWPALERPKGGKPRVARLWACSADVAQSLIDDAEKREGPDQGRLFTGTAP